jgi:hypothetical protein
MRCLIAVFVIAGSAGLAHAGNNELSLGSTSRALRSTSANAVTAESLSGGALAYARDLQLDVLVPGLALWAEGTFAWGDARGMMFQTLSTELDALVLTAGGRAHYALHARVVASARVGLGFSRAALAIRDANGRGAADSGWGAATTGGLGLELRAIDRPQLTLGLRLEVGYTLTSAVAFTAMPPSSDDGTLQLPMTTAGLGSLDLSGSQLAVSLVSQF